MSTPLKLLLFLCGAVLIAFLSRSLYLGIAGPAPPKEEPRVQIRVAAADLPAGLLLRNEDLDWRGVDRSAVPPGAIIEGNPGFQDINGVMVRRNIAAGTPILERDVIRPNSPGFLSAVLRPGMRAVSIGVDAVTGNAGLIQPGDYVDIILVQENSRRGSMEAVQEKARSVVSETIVENARVIAVGSTFLQAAAAEAGSENRNEGRTANNRTVTIEVMPRAAEAVAVASRLGSLTLALRSFAITDRNAGRAEETGRVVALNNHDTGDAPLWAGDVSRALAAATANAQSEPAQNSSTPETPQSPAPATSTVREITIFRGSEQTAQTIGSPRGTR
jgi:pilus assembly protein CpaB